MDLRYIQSTLAAVISLQNRVFHLKDINTPYVKITHLKLKDNLSPSEGFSLYYKPWKAPVITECNIASLEQKASELTTEALKNIHAEYPIKTRFGCANIIMISKGEYIIVAAIAARDDSVTVCNDVSKEIIEMKK